MFLCKKNFFNKLLVFSFIFLCFSVIFCKVQVSATETTSNKKITNHQSTAYIQRQQKIIINRLERIENRMSKEE